MLAQARSIVWPKENPAALAEKRVEFCPHDFFEENPVKGADVYWLRYIMHDWSDEFCVRILRGIGRSMGARSRILICDQVMNTTVGAEELERAPEPLPANWVSFFFLFFLFRFFFMYIGILVLGEKCDERRLTFTTGLLHAVLAPARSRHDVAPQRDRADAARVPHHHRAGGLEAAQDLGLSQSGFAGGGCAAGLGAVVSGGWGEMDRYWK